MSPEVRAERFKRLHIAVLDFNLNTDIRCQKFRSPQGLWRFLDSDPRSDNRDSARLIVVEDLSSIAIELLGWRYDINPQFFRSHLCDYTWYNTRDPWVETPALDSHLKSQSFVHFRYVQPRYFPDEESIERAKRQAGSFNVLRRIDFDTSNKAWADAEEGDIGLVRSSTSFWVRPKESQEQGWLGMTIDTILIELSLTVERSASS